MESSASSIVGSRGTNPPVPPSSKLKTCGIAIAIIAGIGGLAIGAVGLASYFRVGVLSNISQIDAMIMMGAGGGAGIILLIIGVVGIVKSCVTHKSALERAELIRSINTQGGLKYGPEAWKIWNVEILDFVPPAPQVDLSKKDKVLLYIPHRIKVDGKEQDLTLKALKEISGGPFRFFSEDVARQFGGKTSPVWVLIDKNVIGRGEDYETQKRKVEAKGYSMPTVLEAVVLNLMVFAFTEERLFGQEPWTYTRCAGKVDGKYPVVVGGFGSAGLNVRYYLFDGVDYGVACALRKC